MTIEELARFGLFIMAFSGGFLGTGLVGAIMSFGKNDDGLLFFGSWITSLIVIAIMAQYMWTG